MKISDLIEELKFIRERYGEVFCFANGSKGSGDILPLIKGQVCAGSACQFSDNNRVKDDSDIICYIGEY